VVSHRDDQGIDWLVARKAHMLGRVTFSGLRQSLDGMPKSTLSRCLRRLELRGVVHVLVDPDDRRARIIIPGDISPDTVPIPSLVTHNLHAKGIA
jgi:hypothetical protein